MPGTAFRTHCDTEAILALAGTGEPDQWMPRLDGMFAFAIAEGRDLMLARDPLGIKPLYIGQRDGTVIFASELKALQGHADRISEFPEGHYYHNRIGLKRYYMLPMPSSGVVDQAAARQSIRARLEAAVRKRLVADVPVGVFLSGGLDSSLIAALARQHKHPLDTFAVGTPDSADLPMARQVADFLGTRHHVRRFDLREAIDALPEVIYHLESFDCALIRSAVPNYFLAKLASEHVKVALAGEGADELFAGYSYLKDMPADQLNRELRDITLALHHTNLQRCDRMSMAHGLEVRVPFLDVALVDLAFRIPLKLKLSGEQRTEKWILRTVAADLLPHPIAWRAKSKFAAGSGLGDQLGQFAESQISDADFARQRQIAQGVWARSKEEIFYFRIFKQAFPQEELIRLVGRSRSI